ncbi:52L [Xanthomonas phage Xp10]|uniref:52L n=1 Tax=Xanthomonas phage Xp10 TaxID=2907956 RepID=Q7Y5G4_9CAUD|nr:HNH endonuclease [Xanthomonas phage Xp10]AAP58720.1 52L [Xanthomonas phage Xp10]
MSHAILTHQHWRIMMSRYNFESGAKNKFWPKDDKRWRARIKLGGKEVHLGYFDTFEEAIAAREAARAVYRKLQPTTDR